MGGPLSSTPYDLPGFLIGGERQRPLDPRHGQFFINVPADRIEQWDGEKWEPIALAIQGQHEAGIAPPQVQSRGSGVIPGPRRAQDPSVTDPNPPLALSIFRSALNGGLPGGLGATAVNGQLTILNAGQLGVLSGLDGNWSGDTVAGYSIVATVTGTLRLAYTTTAGPQDTNLSNLVAGVTQFGTLSYIDFTGPFANGVTLDRVYVQATGGGIVTVNAWYFFAFNIYAPLFV